MIQILYALLKQEKLNKILGVIHQHTTICKGNKM